MFVQDRQIHLSSWVFPTLLSTALQEKYECIYFSYLCTNSSWSIKKNFFRRWKHTWDTIMWPVFSYSIFYWGISFVSLPRFLSCCRGWMWAHGDVSRQRDPGIQELSWDIPKLHSLWKENPSASRKTPDLKNWRPGYWITEMWIELPYHPELFNIAWYVKEKTVVDTWTVKCVTKSQLSKMQKMSAFVLSSSFSYSSVFSVWEAIAPHTLCCSAEAGGAAMLHCGSATGACAKLWHIHSRALLSDLQSCTITALVQQIRGSMSALFPSW